jgi:hypothetical protein
MRETAEVFGAAKRMVRALGIRVACEDPDGLRHLLDLHAEIDAATFRAVTGLRQSGYTDVQIGEQLGISRQAVQQRWPRPGGVTGAGARYLVPPRKRG